MVGQNKMEPSHQICNSGSPLTEEKIKEIVMETLIELNLISKAEKKKGIDLK